MRLWNIKLIYITLIISVLFNLRAYAAPSEAVATEDKLDITLLLDASASMRVTDPLKLRNEGARLLIQLLRPGDRLAIIEFAEKARVLRPLSPFEREQIPALSNIINTVADDGAYTNLLAPIKTSLQILKETGRGDAQKAIVIFSDGKMDPSAEDGTPQQLTDELFGTTLPQAIAAQIKLYTLSFSQEADKELLAKIATTTEGEHWYTPTADQIHQSFADLFLVAKKPQLLPLTSKGFLVDEDTEEATIYISREDKSEISLINPMGMMITKQSPNPNIKWFKGSNFDVVTILMPQAGQWSINGITNNNSFVAIMTNLKLNVEWPQSIISDIPVLIQAQLYDSQKPIVLQPMTETVNYHFKITPIDRVSEPIMNETLLDNGEDGDKKANDGIFSRRITIEDVGEYRLGVTAIAPTFERYQQTTFQVKPRLITLEIVGREESALARLQASAHQGSGETYNEYFKVTLSPEATALNKVEVKLIAVDKDKNSLVLPIRSIDNYFECETDVLPLEGKYEIKAELKAKTKSRKRGESNDIRAESRPITYLKTHTTNTNDREEITLVTMKPVHKTNKKSKALKTFLINLLILSATIALLGWAIYVSLKKHQDKSASSESADLQHLSALDSTIAAIMSLEARSQKVDVDLNDPIFTDDRYLAANAGRKILNQEDQVAPAAPADVDVDVDVDTDVVDTEADTDTDTKNPDDTTEES